MLGGSIAMLQTLTTANVAQGCKASRSTLYMNSSLNLNIRKALRATSFEPIM